VSQQDLPDFATHYNTARKKNQNFLNFFLHFGKTGVSIYFKRANTVYECACETADMRLIYGRRISSESKIICKADLREVQGH